MERMAQSKLKESREDRTSDNALTMSARDSRRIGQVLLNARDAIVGQIYRRREDQGLHHRRGARDARPATRGTDRAGRHDRPRWLPAGDDRAQPRRARARLHEAPGLRHARGRQGGRTGRAAPPPDPHLRGGGRRDNQRCKSSGAIFDTVESRCQPTGSRPGARLLPFDHDPARASSRSSGRSRSTPRAWPTISSPAATTRSSRGRGHGLQRGAPIPAGDDVRFIDWNVSARMNDTYVKVFTEEREMTVMLLVDLSGEPSASPRWASRSTRRSAEIAALLAFSAIKNNDRVGLILFTDRVERFVPAQEGQGPRDAGGGGDPQRQAPSSHGDRPATALWTLLGERGRSGKCGRLS